MNLPQILLSEIIENKHVKHNNKINAVSKSSELSLSKSYISLSYVPGLREKFQRILRKYNIDSMLSVNKTIKQFPKFREGFES